MGGRVIFQSEFSSSPRVTAVGGCKRSLPPIFTGCLSKLRLVTEVVLLLNACIQQRLAGNLMNPAAIGEYVCKKQRYIQRRSNCIKAGGLDKAACSYNYGTSNYSTAPIHMPSTAQCMFFYRPFVRKLFKGALCSFFTGL